MKMKMSFRWYGESDPVSLQYISQIPGMRSIVSAVYDVKPGQVWPNESLAEMVKQCEANGLVFDVVESIPVHEDIKLGRPTRDKYIENYLPKEMFDKLVESGLTLESLPPADENKLTYYPDIKNPVLAKAKQIIKTAAEEYEPSILTRYIIDVASYFSKYYNEHQIITDNKELTEARTALIYATGLIIKEGMNILGIKCPERM